MCRSHVNGSEKKKKRGADKDEVVQDQVSVFAVEEIQQKLEKIPSRKNCGSKISIYKCCTC